MWLLLHLTSVDELGQFQDRWDNGFFRGSLQFLLAQCFCLGTTENSQVYNAIDSWDNTEVWWLKLLVGSHFYVFFFPHSNEVSVFVRIHQRNRTNRI